MQYNVIVGAIQCDSSFNMFMQETLPPLMAEHTGLLHGTALSIGLDELSHILWIVIKL